MEDLGKEARVIAYMGHGPLNNRPASPMVLAQCGTLPRAATRQGAWPSAGKGPEYGPTITVLFTELAGIYYIFG